MANIKSAQKRARQNEKRRIRNASLRSKLRTFIKKVRVAIASQDFNVAFEAYKNSVPVIDKMVTKGIIHINAASRYKSRLNAKVKALKA